MKQIGARQEAGRIGGIGPCGRELCCSSWMTSFVSVATGAARYQDISMNPQKLAGQCAKLKCCINYEVDTYVEAQKRLPSREIVLRPKIIITIISRRIFSNGKLPILRINHLRLILSRFRQAVLSMSLT